MDLLLASTEGEWEGWIAKVLLPVAGVRVPRNPPERTGRQRSLRGQASDRA